MIKASYNGMYSLYISAEDIDDIDFAWEHDRKLVRAALEGGG